MKWLSTFIQVLTVLSISTWATYASAGCVKQGKVVTGTLEKIQIREFSGRITSQFVLVLKRKLCIRVGNKRVTNVRQMAIDAVNANRSELKQLLGLKVALYGTFKRTRKRKLDAVLHDAVIVGAYDPRNRKFHRWRRLKKRLALMRRRRQGDAFNRKNVEPDSKALTKLIRKTLRESSEQTERTERPRRAPVSKERCCISRGTPHDEIVTFILDYFLSFPKMHPSEVVEYYIPFLEYNGNENVRREAAVQHKFTDFWAMPNQTHKLLKRSVKIRKSRRLSGAYHVSFLYDVKRNFRGRTFSTRKSARLVLDLELDDIQIRKETVKTLHKRSS